MPKTKRQSAAKKRFKVTGTGKVMRRPAMRSHLLEKKSPKRKRRMAKPVEISENDAGRVNKLLPGGAGR